MTSSSDGVPVRALRYTGTTVLRLRSRYSNCSRLRSCKNTFHKLVSTVIRARANFTTTQQCRSRRSGKPQLLNKRRNNPGCYSKITIHTVIQYTYPAEFISEFIIFYFLMLRLHSSFVMTSEPRRFNNSTPSPCRFQRNFSSSCRPWRK
jgi:hypothetical protein